MVFQIIVRFPRSTSSFVTLGQVFIALSTLAYLIHLISIQLCALARVFGSPPFFIRAISVSHRREFSDLRSPQSRHNSTRSSRIEAAIHLDTRELTYAWIPCHHSSFLRDNFQPVADGSAEPQPLSISLAHALDADSIQRDTDSQSHAHSYRNAESNRNSNSR